MPWARRQVAGSSGTGHARRRWPMRLVAAGLLIMMAIPSSAGAQAKGVGISGRPMPSTTQPPDTGEAGSEGGGKGTDAPPPGSSVAASPRSKPVRGFGQAQPQAVAPRESSLDVAMVAGAMIALLLVIGQGLLIWRLRRRVALLGSPPPEELGPPEPTLEGA